MRVAVVSIFHSQAKSPNQSPLQRVRVPDRPTSSSIETVGKKKQNEKTVWRAGGVHQEPTRFAAYAQEMAAFQEAPHCKLEDIEQLRMYRLIRSEVFLSPITGNCE